MDFEDILEDLGGYGKFQKGLVWWYLFPASAILPWFTMNQIFMLSSPAHQCVVPHLNSLNLTQEQLTNLTSLVDETQCYINTTIGSLYSHNINGALNDTIRWLASQEDDQVPCQDFTYNTVDYEATAATQWNLVCGSAHLISLVYTLCNLGMAIGTIIFGLLADKLGRKITFFITVFVTVVTGTASVLVSGFYTFLVLRFLNSTVMPSIFQIPYIILLEIVGPHQRTMMLGIGCLAWTLGLCALPLIAWLSRTYVILGIVSSVCALPYAIYWWYLPESPRWLLSQSRIEETAEILRGIGKKNGVKEVLDLDLKLRKAEKKIQEEKQESAKHSPLDLLRKAKIRKHFLIITVAWIANGATYYGLHINVSNLGGNEFLNFLLLGLVELPAYFSGWWAMEKFGRRWPNVFFQILSGIFCALPVFMPDGADYVAITASLVAKYACSAAFMMMYQQAAELMPTPIRSMSLGSASSCSAFFTICMPYIIFLGQYGNWIPFLFLTVLAMSAGISSAWLPETLGYNLCQTIEDADDFGKGQKFFSFNRRRSSKAVPPTVLKPDLKSEKELVEYLSNC